MAESFNPAGHMLGGGLLLLASVAGVGLPPLLHLNPRRSVSLETGVRLGTCFGFGTILATAVVHMLPSAVHSLMAGSGPDPNQGVREAYPHLAYWIILGSLLGMHFLDWAVAAAAPSMLAAHHHHHHHHGCDEGEEADEPLAEDSLLRLAAAQNSGSLNGHDAETPPRRRVTWEDEQTPLIQGRRRCRRASSSSLTGDTVGLILLELGVSVHSVLIGVGLGVARGATFRTLLAALCVHQFFEGLALGSAAADVAAAAGLNFALAAAFSLSTPLGVVIGVGLREAAGERSAASAVLEGSLEAGATGVLLYVSLVQLLAPHMSRAAWMRKASWQLKSAAFVALWLGAATMAGLGNWV